MHIRVALALGLLACSAAAQPPTTPAPPASPASNENAATAYRSAWRKMNEGLKQAAASARFGASGLEAEGAGGDLDQVKSKLRTAQPLIKELVRASKLERCDFGLKYDPKAGEKQMSALHDIAASARDAARILGADAARVWGEGDIDGAVDRIAASYRMSAQLADEPVVLVALVNAATITLANEATRVMVEGAGGGAGKSLTAAQRRRLLDALNRLDRADPAGIKRARKAEGEADAKAGESMDRTHLRLTSDLAKTRRILE